MKTTKPKRKENGAVTVASFVEAGRKDLFIRVIAAEAGLNRPILEAALNRPGLALAGFFRYFACRRIQVMGLAEYAYLGSLSESQRNERLRDFFARKIPCVVICRKMKTYPEMKKLGEEFRVPVLTTRMITKHFVNAATIVMENLSAPHATIQGTMVEIMGIGVLIEGKPGMGKSEAALELIKVGDALVSDDVTCLRLDSAGSIIGSPSDVTRYHMEIKGLGIIHVPSLFGVASVRESKRLDLVVTLCDPKNARVEDGAMGIHSTSELLGVEIPRVFVPVAPGRNLANVIRTAALDQRLRRLGHDAIKELDQKLISLMNRGEDASE
ncbi:MAG: HPr(Ser) kinase/phosphatase [Verrucomicrobiota bacterium]|nr:HPr(Ser) kinase/phosphatase [Verrucomicrobiota bacterium]